MGNLFITILNISITASYIALAAMVLRLLLKKNPKWISCLLWALVAIRLLVPFSFESKLSLIPDSEPVKVTSSVSNSKVDTTPQSHIVNNQEIVDTHDTPVTPVTPITPDKSEDTPVQDIAPITPDADTQTTEEKEPDISSVLSYIWIGGAGCMIAYSALSYLRIKARVRASIKTDKSIYICDDISTPFILGVIKPRIYLPSTLLGDELEYITNHEKAHLKRCDHLWKPLGFILLSLHWFNPLMWVSYILLCRDIELACDEKVLKDMGTDSKKHYSETLLSFSTERRLISACPLAFGEVGVKSRIKNILNYKKPAFWITALSIILCLAVGFCFLTNPVSDKEDKSSTDTKSSLTDSLPDILPADCITDNYLLYTYQIATNPTKTSYIKLYPEDKGFELMLNPLSSYLPLGTYTIDGKKLILESDSDDNSYVFEFLDPYTLMFIMDESSDLPEYKYSEEDTEPSPPFYDRSLFAIANTEYKGSTQSRETVIPYTYEEIVEIIIDAYPWNHEDGSAPLPDFPHASYMYFRRDDLSEVGYALIDLDKNGVDELVLSDFNNSFVYDVYTIVDGKTVHLFSSGERYAHILYENGYIELQWSGSAAHSGHDFMKLNDGRLEFVERITLDAYYAEESGLIEKLEDAGSDNCFFKSTSRNTKNYVHISDDEALELIDSHKNKTKKLNLVFAPFSTYNPGDIGSEVTQNHYVEFDIDGDGIEEKCLISALALSSTKDSPMYLSVYDKDMNNKGSYKIPDVTIDSTRSTATNFYLKTASGKLYLFMEENIGSRSIYELSYSNGSITTAYTMFVDIIDFNIDNDSAIETLSINHIYAYSSKGLPFSITISENGLKEYYNTFDLSDCIAVRFETENDQLYLVTTNNISLERNYKVIVDNGNITLNESNITTIDSVLRNDLSIFTSEKATGYITSGDKLIDIKSAKNAYGKLYDFLKSKSLIKVIPDNLIKSENSIAHFSLNDYDENNKHFGLSGYIYENDIIVIYTGSYTNKGTYVCSGISEAAIEFCSKLESETNRYYTLIYEDYKYTYEIKKSDGTVIERKTNSRQPHITYFPEDKIISVMIQSGTGTLTRSTVYYNIKTGEIYKPYYGISNYKNGLALSTGHSNVTIINLQKPERTQVIDKFEMPISTFVENICGAEFTEDFTKVKVTYYSGEYQNGEEVVKITEYFDIDKKVLFPN